MVDLVDVRKNETGNMGIPNGRSPGFGPEPVHGLGGH